MLRDADEVIFFSLQMMINKKNPERCARDFFVTLTFQLGIVGVGRDLPLDGRD